MGSHGNVITRDLFASINVRYPATLKQMKAAVGHRLDMQ
jgi:hypothetical protein